MSSFDGAWTDLEFAQEVLEQLPRGHNLVLLDKLKNSEDRICYAKKTIENNWSHNNLKSLAFLSLAVFNNLMIIIKKVKFCKGVFGEFLEGK